MSTTTTQIRRDKPAAGLSEEAVAHFLESHPEFFERHAQLLAKLTLPHQVGSSTVSLVERQVDILRERNRKTERQLRELVMTARNNDDIAKKIHLLSVRLIASLDFGQVIDRVESTLRQVFEADETIMVLFRKRLSDKSEYPDLRFLRWTDLDADEMKPFGTFLKNATPRCGQVRDAQRDFLFGGATDEIGSVVMIPLGVDCDVGFLAIGSADSQRFHPAMSTDYLSQIGELVSTALTR